MTGTNTTKPAPVVALDLRLSDIRALGVRVYADHRVQLAELTPRPDGRGRWWLAGPAITFHPGELRSVAALLLRAAVAVERGLAP